MQKCITLQKRVYIGNHFNSNITSLILQIHWLYRKTVPYPSQMQFL